jgi:polyhydroxyalkanoate synthesis regulator protein
VTRSWADAQRRLWEGWLEGLRQASGGFSAPTGGAPSQTFARNLDTWESFVRQTLDAQSSAMQAWAEQLAATPNLPPSVSAQVQQVQELTRGWTDTQRQLWDATFAAVRQWSDFLRSQTGGRPSR